MYIYEVALVYDFLSETLLLNTTVRFKRVFIKKKKKKKKTRTISIERSLTLDRFFFTVLKQISNFVT